MPAATDDGKRLPLTDKQRWRLLTSRRRQIRTTISRRAASLDFVEPPCTNVILSNGLERARKLSEYQVPDDGISISSSSISSVCLNDTGGGSEVSPARILNHNDSIIETSGQIQSSSYTFRSASLEAKAMSILERELLFEKLLAHSKAHLDLFEQQMSEFGSRYVAVRRSTGGVTSRKRVEIPELPPSPILGETNVLEEKSTNKSLDEIDEDFTRVLRFSPPKNRPPLAPVPFGRHSVTGSTNRLSLSKPLLASIPRRASLGKEN